MRLVYNPSDGNHVCALSSGFGMVAGFLEEQLFRWLRAAELTCDRAALLVVQDPKVPFTFSKGFRFEEIS
jgi:hypothetical protein